MISKTNVLNDFTERKEKKNNLKKQLHRKPEIIEPEDENSGRKLTSQSTQSLSQLVLHLIKFRLPHNDILSYPMLFRSS